MILALGSKQGIQGISVTADNMIETGRRLVIGGSREAHLLEKNSSLNLHQEA